jgi:hypothetical protein
MIKVEYQSVERKPIYADAMSVGRNVILLQAVLADATRLCCLMPPPPGDRADHTSIVPMACRHISSSAARLS